MTIFKASKHSAAKRQAILDYVSRTPIGATVTFADLSKHIGVPVDGASDPQYQYARMKAPKAIGRVMLTDYGLQQFRVANAEEISAHSDRRFKAVRATGRRIGQAVAVAMGQTNDPALLHNLATQNAYASVLAGGFKSQKVAAPSDKVALKK